MRTDLYKRHRFPTEIISHCVWLYHRFDMSFRAVAELLFERGVVLSYETVRRWCIQFGSEYARRLKRCRAEPRDKWHLDEVFLNIGGERRYLWRAADQRGNTLDILVTRKRDKRAAKSFLRTLLRERLAAEALEALQTLRAAVVAGQVEVVGASYGQPYGLCHGGTSNALQRIYGVCTAARLLGVRPKTFWKDEFSVFPQVHRTGESR